MGESNLQLLLLAKENSLTIFEHLNTVSVMEQPTKVSLPAVRAALMNARNVNAALQGLERRLLGMVTKVGD